MKITKTQLQKLIREEINTLSEDEQLDELFGFGKEHIGAVTFESFLHAILGVDIVEVVVTPVGGN